MKNITKNEIRLIISGARKVRFGSAIQSAARYLRRSKTAGQKIKEPKLIKKEEAERLKIFITRKNLWTKKNLFKNYLSEGAEQKVYFLGGKNVVKTNDCVFYNSWEDYFKSLLLHNYFFPDTAYQLKGFTEKDGKLFSVVKQTYVVETEKTDLSLVKIFMSSNGFVNNKNNDYQHPAIGIIIEDLHDENVLTKNGILYFIDTVFYLTKPL